MRHDYADIRKRMGVDLAKTHHSHARPLDAEERAALADDLRAIASSTPRASSRSCAR